jgi:hypothetical protein
VSKTEVRFALEKFIVFGRSLKGDKKSEARSFLYRFFRGLGHADASSKPGPLSSSESPKTPVPPSSNSLATIVSDNVAVDQRVLTGSESVPEPAWKKWVRKRLGLD